MDPSGEDVFIDLGRTVLVLVIIVVIWAVAQGIAWFGRRQEGRQRDRRRHDRW